MTKELAKAIVKEIAKQEMEDCSKCALTEFCDRTEGAICVDASLSLKAMEE